MTITTTIIYAHPYEKSFNHAILERVQELLKEKGEQYRLIDLYQDGFNPVYTKEELALFNKGEALDPLVKQYQEVLVNTRRLIFIFPIWWASMPAIVKGYLDKVLLKTFAYIEKPTGPSGLLDLDEVVAITTSTAPTFYLRFFCGNPIAAGMLGHTMKGVGAKRRRWINCGRANKTTDARRKAFLDRLAKYI